MGEFGAVSVVSGHIRGETNTLPLHVEILYNEYNFVGGVRGRLAAGAAGAGHARSSKIAASSAPRAAQDCERATQRDALTVKEASA